MLGEERSSAHDVSSMIRITAVLVGVSSLLGLLSRVRDQHPFDLGTGVGLTLVLACAAVFQLSRTRWHQAASVGFLALAWVAVGAISSARGGLNAGTVGLYLLTIMLAGVVVSGRAAAVLCGLSVPATILLLVAEAQGVIPLNAGVSVFQRGLTATLTLVVTTFIALTALKLLRQATGRETQAKQHLLEANLKLVETAALLEETVQQRTRSLEEARDQALAAARTKMAFLANMSHELRTPMHAIVAVSELMKALPLPAEARELVDISLKSGDAMVAMLDDLLDLAKIEAGGLSVERRPYDLSATVAEVASLLTPLAQKKGLKLEVNRDAQLPASVFGDRARLRQVLTNLVGNALKFTETGTVELSTRWEAGQAHFAVQDTGIGLAPASLERLFQPFMQVDASTTRRIGGTGLGLAISKQLVELMGGRLDVTSQLGVGSRFEFTVAAPVAPVTTSAAGERAPAPTRVLQVLLAEDNAINQRIARVMLEQLGHGVHLAETGTQALEVVQRETVDAVLMDVYMPEMDGLSATRAIRSSDGRPRLWVIALTASALPEERKACFDAGVDDFLTKPLKLETLRGALARVPAREASGAPRRPDGHVAASPAGDDAGGSPER